MEEKNNNPTTLEDLAAIVKEGFSEMATKNDLEEIRGQMATKNDLENLATMVKHGFDGMATKEELHNLHEIVQDIAEELNATHADVSYIRNTVNNLVLNDVAQDESIEKLTSRVGLLERKTGLA